MDIMNEKRRGRALNRANNNNNNYNDNNNERKEVHEQKWKSRGDEVSTNASSVVDDYIDDSQTHNFTERRHLRISSK